MHQKSNYSVLSLLTAVSIKTSWEVFGRLSVYRADKRTSPSLVRNAFSVSNALFSILSYGKSSSLCLIPPPVTSQWHFAELFLALPETKSITWGWNAWKERNKGLLQSMEGVEMVQKHAWEIWCIVHYVLYYSLITFQHSVCTFKWIDIGPICNMVCLSGLFYRATFHECRSDILSWYTRLNRLLLQANTGISDYSWLFLDWDGGLWNKWLLIPILPDQIIILLFFLFFLQSSPVLFPQASNSHRRFPNKLSCITLALLNQTI